MIVLSKLLVLISANIFTSESPDIEIRRWRLTNQLEIWKSERVQSCYECFLILVKSNTTILKRKFIVWLSLHCEHLH